MKILVGTKRVIDYNIHVRIKDDATDVDLEHVKMSMNPFDEIALEEAIKLKEAGSAQEVIAICVDKPIAQDILRTALAMGADRAILISTQDLDPAIALQPLHIAKIFKQLAHKEQADMVFMGKQAIDNDANQTGQMLAGLLDWPQATFASKIEIGAHEAVVEREVDGGIEKIAVNLPAVMTADLRLNEPRFIGLPNIMKARKKTIDIYPIDEFLDKPKPHVALLKVEAPASREAPVKIDDIDALAKMLKNYVNKDV